MIQVFGPPYVGAYIKKFFSKLISNRLKRATLAYFSTSVESTLSYWQP